MGLFVVFEGLDGAGKSTQIQLLAERMRSEKTDVELVREPGGTEAGEAIRAIMFGPEAKPLLPMTWAFLMNSARAQLVEERIVPALRAGRTVIADRYWYSTLAYQGGGDGLDPNLIEALSKTATRGVNPDVVVYLDLPPAEVANRKEEETANVLDRRPLDFHERVAGAYRNMVESRPEMWLAFSAVQPRETLSDSIYSAVRNIFQPAGQEVAR